MQTVDLENLGCEAASSHIVMFVQIKLRLRGLYIVRSKAFQSQLYYQILTSKIFSALYMLLVIDYALRLIM